MVDFAQTTTFGVLPDSLGRAVSYLPYSAARLCVCVGVCVFSFFPTLFIAYQHIYDAGRVNGQEAKMEQPGGSRTIWIDFIDHK